MSAKSSRSEVLECCCKFYAARPSQRLAHLPPAERPKQRHGWRWQVPQLWKACCAVLEFERFCTHNAGVQHIHSHLIRHTASCRSSPPFRYSLQNWNPQELSRCGVCTIALHHFLSSPEIRKYQALLQDILSCKMLQIGRRCTWCTGRFSTSKKWSRAFSHWQKHSDACRSFSQNTGSQRSSINITLENGGEKKLSQLEANRSRAFVKESNLSWQLVIEQLQRMTIISRSCYPKHITCIYLPLETSVLNGGHFNNIVLPGEEIKVLSLDWPR